MNRKNAFTDIYRACNNGTNTEKFENCLRGVQLSSIHRCRTNKSL